MRRLDVFGFAASDRFDPSRSDVDFVVEFEDIPLRGYAANYFALADVLEELLGRPVDLVTRRSIENPYFAASVEKSRQNVYAA